MHGQVVRSEQALPRVKPHLATDLNMLCLTWLGPPYRYLHHGTGTGINTGTCTKHPGDAEVQQSKWKPPQTDDAMCTQGVVGGERCMHTKQP